MAKAIAKEALALGFNQLFAPLGDLARELRYGRVEETFGEDAHLTGEMAYAYVKGLQSGNVSAMVKHFAGVATPEQGINTAPVHGGERGTPVSLACQRALLPRCVAHTHHTYTTSWREQEATLPSSPPGRRTPHRECLGLPGGRSGG